ncbi:DUF3604 domain-containing protein [SAR92 clade bacterium H246]
MRDFPHVFHHLLITITVLLWVAIPTQANNSPNTSSGYGATSVSQFRQVYWGDTHLHTSLSLDAYTYGNTELGPEQAYRFAKGEAVIASNGMWAKLNRPLDFLVIADHASNMGAIQQLQLTDTEKNRSPLAKVFAEELNRIHTIMTTDKAQAVQRFDQLAIDGFTKGRLLDKTTQHSVWAKVTELADRHNEPGLFTAFIGYEWTQLFYNLHRVVIFKGSAAQAGQVMPFDQYDSSDPEDLWDYMAEYERQTQDEVLAIPHNGNISNGLMFALETANGEPLTEDYARKRSRWEPLFEVTQIKGDSESHPLLSPDDNFADYETVTPQSFHSDWAELTKETLGLTDYDAWVAKKIAQGDKTWNYTYGYARPALKLGLQQQAKLGINPFKFGMIGSTDSHTSLAAVEENNFWGKLSRMEPYPNRILGSWGGEGIPINKKSESFYDKAWRTSASGYAAVWAEENTREALFAAMRRKEVYASTGPRITVRFFGGWEYQKDDAHRPDLARIGYKKGVPMGGDLTQPPPNKSPNFLIRALRDPDGANLDRVQVIKGWHDISGALHEKIYNVALSDDRTADNHGNVPPVASTVDILDASYVNTIGDPELAVVWEDPDFNPDEPAFYYLRVLEIPTPRWTAYDAKYFNLKDIPEEVPMITQERAYTSPIWYTP